MDYNVFDEVLDECGVAADPAILNPDLKVSIKPLPPKYEKEAYGLYWPDGTIQIPPESDKETAKHEVGHALCDYYFNDMGEPCAEEFHRRVNMRSAAMLERPDVQRGASCRCRPSMLAINKSGRYTTITEISGPSEAAPGDTVNISAIIRNDHSDNLDVYVEAVVSGTRFIDQLETIPVGESRPYSGAFIMPGGGAVVAEIHVLYYSLLGYTEDEVGTIAVYPPSWATWQTVAQADSLETFKSAIPSIDDLPEGTPVNIHIEFPSWLPAGPIANLAGAEWVAQRFASEADIHITDVHSESLYSMDIDGIASGWAVPVGIIIIVAILSALGIAYITSITLTAYWNQISKEEAYAQWNKVYDAQIAAYATPAEAVAAANAAVAAAAKAAIAQPINPTSDIVKYVAIGAGVLGIAALGIAAIQGFGKRELYQLRA